jgi:hypothetical protein
MVRFRGGSPFEDQVILKALIVVAGLHTANTKTVCPAVDEILMDVASFLLEWPTLKQRRPVGSRVSQQV